MDRLPAEVLRMVCAHLSFKDAANVRFITRELSDIAAEFVITRLCFHTSRASLDRLERIANHPVFSGTVKSLVYEAALLADVKCRHEFVRHFEQEAHHLLEQPKEPPSTATPREHRLYLRNKVKWTQNIYAKYDSYRALFDAQKTLLKDGTVEEVLSRCLPKFFKLSSIDMDPIRRCTHLTSRRFIEEFGSDCGSPLSGSLNRTGEQLGWVLLPKNTIVSTLRKLEVNSLSPSFFKPSQRHLLEDTFSRLTDIDIVLKLADNDINTDEHHGMCYHRLLSNSVLKDALASAMRLEFLSLGIETSLPFFVEMSDVLPDTTWSTLKSLNLNTITSTQQHLMTMLKRQPNLKSLHLALMELTDGNWASTITEMRQLHLLSFMPTGFLEDADGTWPMDMINIQMYIDIQDEWTLGDAIDLYVTDPDLDDMDGEANPLDDPFSDYGDLQELREIHGIFTDSDDDSMSLDEDSDGYLSQEPAGRADEPMSDVDLVST